MSSDPRPWLSAAALLFCTAAAAGQSTLQRSPGLSGGWTGVPGQAHFHFLHRFQASAAPARKVSSSPTFLLAYSAVDRLLLGAHYATASDVVANYPNEWEAFARWALVPGVSVQGGYDVAAESVDGAVDAHRRFGPLHILGAARAFSSAYGGDAAVALGGGAAWELGLVGLAADYTKVVSADHDGAWSAAVQLRIPASPHTLSLQATNANTGTLQGSSRGSGATRYGFEFTIPITLARYVGARVPVASLGAEGRDTVTIEIRNLRYSPERIEVSPGTRVRWVNRDPLEHTTTASGQWDSGLIPADGGTWEHTFATPGEYGYTCTPHPFMKGVVVVKRGGDQ